MLFNTFKFAYFFAILFPTYWALQKHLKAQNLLLLAAGYFFYACWEPKFLAILILSTVVDFLCGLWVDRIEAPGKRKLFVLISMALNLGMLGYFKYVNFFAESLKAALARGGYDVPLWHIEVVLPIGISFYTFQSMSYVIDVYRKDIKPTRNLLEFATFVSFFPHLVAGPIMRPTTLLPQIQNRRKFDLEQIYQGAYLIFWGLTKKVVVADNLAPIVNDLFGKWQTIDGGLALLAVYAFAFQIYCDFSGYTDAARGIAKCLGIELALELQAALLRGQPAGVLEPVAHQPVEVAARLPLHPAGREPRRLVHHLPEPDADHDHRRPLARGGLDVHPLGGVPGPDPGRAPAGQAAPEPGPAAGAGRRSLLAGAADRGDVPDGLPGLADLPRRVDGAVARDAPRDHRSPGDPGGKLPDPGPGDHHAAPGRPVRPVHDRRPRHRRPDALVCPERLLHAAVLRLRPRWRVRREPVHLLPVLRGGGAMADGRLHRFPLPWGLLGMLALVIGAEWTLSKHDLDFTAPWHWDWRTTGSLAARKQGRAEVLLFGDSLMKFGVMPRVVADRSGHSSYNFALHTGQTSSSYFMLRRVLAAGNHPRAVVLDLTPHMFFQPTAENARLWPELLTPAEALDLARTMRDPSFLGTTVLGRYLPSYKERHDIRASVLGALTGAPYRNWRGEIPTYRRNWRQNDGAQLMPDGESPAIDPTEWVQKLYSRWAPDPVNVAYLDRFLALAGAAQIPVVWLLPPVQPSVQARTEASGFDAAYSAFVRSVADRFPAVTVLDARHSGFEAAEFNDGIHLKRPGALRLSAAIGTLIHEGLPGNQWVQLDAGRPRSVEYPLEDVGQSAIALHPELGKVRQ